MINTYTSIPSPIVGTSDILQPDLKAYMVVCIDRILTSTYVREKHLMGRLDANAAEAKAREDMMMAQIVPIKEALATQKGSSFDYDFNFNDFSSPPNPCPLNLTYYNMHLIPIIAS